MHIYSVPLSREARISHRLQEDLQIEPTGPVLDVVEILRDPGVRAFSSVSTSPRNPLTWAQPVMPGLTR